VWCEGSTGVPREFGERSKRRKKKSRNKKITLHHRADYFIQNVIFHYLIEKKRGCVAERETGMGHFFGASGIRYRIFYK
jgi:hypothetical protein